MCFAICNSALWCAVFGLASLFAVPLIVIGLLLIVLLWKWLTHRPESFKTKCFAQSTTFNDMIIPQLEAIRYNFPFYYNRHVGACVPLGHDHEVVYDRIVTTHSCGAQFAADWYPNSPTGLPKHISSCCDDPSVSHNSCNSSDCGVHRRMTKRRRSRSRADRNEAADGANTSNNQSTDSNSNSSSGLLPRGVCVFIPGLCSNSDHKYVKQFALRMAATGYSTVVVTARGVGMPLSTDDVWHPALTDDVHAVLLKQIPRGIAIHLVAFSAGTNILRKVLIRLHNEDLLAPLSPLSAMNNEHSSQGRDDMQSTEMLQTSKQDEQTPPTTRRRSSRRSSRSNNGSTSDVDSIVSSSSSSSSNNYNSNGSGYGNSDGCRKRRTRSEALTDEYDSTHEAAVNGVDSAEHRWNTSSGADAKQGYAAKLPHKLHVFCAMSVCVAGEDYERARVFLESPHRGEDKGSVMHAQPMKDHEVLKPSVYQHQHQHACADGNTHRHGRDDKESPLRELWEVAAGLVWNLEGHFYTLMMASLYKSIIFTNQHVHGKGRLSEELLADVARSSTMSALDRRCNWLLFGYPSERAMMRDFSVQPNDLCRIQLPWLVIQPLDDPLHKSSPYHSIEVDLYTANPHIIYTETTHGNHFGFYEGSSLRDAYRCKSCYSYPPTMAAAFFGAVRASYECTSNACSDATVSSKNSGIKKGNGHVCK